MDQTEHNNIQSLTKFITPQFLKKVTKLLLSVSVFSFFLSYSTWYSFLLHSFKFHFSTFSSQFLSHTMDKNCIFLICNGLLVLLAKTSGFIRFLRSSNLNDQIFKKIGDGDGEGLHSVSEIESLLEKEVSLESNEPLQNVVVVEEEYSMERESEVSNMIVEDKEQQTPSGLLKRGGEEEAERSVIPTTENEENGKELDTIGFLLIEEDEDKEEEEENWMLSTEELNKKCDDFIRRMKEEIRIGAQQQLVMVQ